MALFEGFTPRDFEAFDEAKWGSHAFNRERLEIKLKLSALGKRLQAELPEVLKGQELGLTEERPSIFNQQRVKELTLFFLRDADARRDLGGILDKAKSMADNVLDPALHHRHLVLGLCVHRRGMDAGLFLHRDAWVDWKNVVLRCKEPIEQEKFGQALSALPDEVRYARGERIPGDAPSARHVPVADVLAGFEAAAPWSLFGEHLSPEDPRLADERLPAALIALVSALHALHAFIGWRRDNDHHALKGVLRERKEQAERRFSELKIGDEVRVTKGLAAGRVGVVESMEHKGLVKVRLGQLVVAVQIGDLAQP